MAITQAVITFAFCIAFGLFYVRSVAKNRARVMRPRAPTGPASFSPSC